MNLPNTITLFRILLIPIIILLTITYPYGNLYNIFIKTLIIKIIINKKIFFYEIPINYFIGGILFIIASLSDALDGYIARKYNKITIFGKFFDAISDKILINSILIIFSCGNIIPIWITIILIIRDFIIDGIRQILATKNKILSSNKIGKYKTIFQMSGIILLFFINKNSIFKTFKKDDNNTNIIIINQLLLLPLYISLFLSIISMIYYIKINKNNIFKNII